MIIMNVDPGHMEVEIVVTTDGNEYIHKETVKSNDAVIRVLELIKVLDVKSVRVDTRGVGIGLFQKLEKIIDANMLQACTSRRVEKEYVKTQSDCSAVATSASMKSKLTRNRPKMKITLNNKDVFYKESDRSLSQFLSMIEKEEEKHSFIQIGDVLVRFDSIASIEQV